MQDAPIEQPTESLEDSPIMPSTEVTGKSKDTDSYEGGQAAFLDNYVTGSSVMDNYNYYSGVIDKSEDLRRLSAQKAVMDSEAVAQEFVEKPEGEAGSIQQNSEAVKASMQQAMSQSVDPDRQFVETLVGENVDLEEVDKQAAYSRMYKIVSDAEEEIDGWDIGADFVVSALPGVHSWRGASLTGKYLGQEGMIKQAITKFKNKPIEEQEAMFPYLKKHLEDTVGDVSTIRILSNFLKPLGSENSQGYSDVWKIFDVIDAAGLAAPIKYAFKSLKGGFNTAKAASALGNDQAAIDISIAAAADPSAAKAAGLDPLTATENLLPYDTTIESIGKTPGLSAKALRELDGYFGTVDKTAEDIMMGNTFLKEGIVNTEQRAILEAETLSRLKAEKHDNIRITSQDDTSTTFSYQALDEEGNLADKTHEMSLSLNDAGHYEQSEIGLIAKYLGSPSAHARGTLKGDVNTSQRVDYLSDRLNKQLLFQVRDALKPIGTLPTKKNRAAHAKVDNALIQGDEWMNADGTRGYLFDTDELVAKFGLEEAEISSYYRLNRLYNNLHRIRNHEMRQTKKLQGHKGVNFSRNGEMMDGSPSPLPMMLIFP